MNSISPQQEQALRDFFHANLAGANRPAVFPEVPAGAPSYWRPRQQKRLTKEDFEIRLGDADEAGDTLDRFWAGTPLAGLGRRLAILSREFPEVREKADVSSLIYEMF